METDLKWLFTKEQIANSPSRKYNINADQEIKYRQQCASFIQDLGQSLKLPQLCINTAIVYMHRFFMFHSMTKFDKYKIGSAAILLASKTEESPAGLQNVIFQSHKFLYKKDGILTPDTEKYSRLAEELIFNENMLLMTLGFELRVEHPHIAVLDCCTFINASKDLSRTSYFMATNSLHLTTMCLQYKPVIIACFCVHLSSKWTSFNISRSKHGKPWFWYIEKDVTYELLDQLTKEFLHEYHRCPVKLKRIPRSNPENKQILDQRNQVFITKKINQSVPILKQEFTSHRQELETANSCIPERSFHQNEQRQQEQSAIPPLSSKPMTVFSIDNILTTKVLQNIQDWKISEEHTSISPPVSQLDSAQTNLQLAGPSHLPQNLLKRPAIDEQNVPHKRQRISHDTDSDANSTIDTEMSELSDLKPTIIHQVPACAPVNELRNCLTPEVFSMVPEISKIEENAFGPQDSSNNFPLVNECPTVVDVEGTFNSTPTIQSFDSSSILDDRLQGQNFSSVQAIPPVEEDLWSVQDVSDFVPDTNKCEENNLTSAFDLSQSTVDFSQIFLDPINEGILNNLTKNDREHKCTKFEEKQKKKRDKKKSGHEQYCDNINVEENLTMSPFEISIPEENFNFSCDSTPASESIEKPLQENILKMKISKKPIYSVESDSSSKSSPSSESSESSFSFNVQNDQNSNDISWMKQYLQSISEGY